MKELLEEFVRLAPKEWGEGWVHELGCICFLNGECPNIYIPDDKASAEAIIFLWDWFRGHGYYCEWTDADDGFCLDVREPGEQENTYTGYVFEFAATRIEALLRAVIAVPKETSTAE